ncbi:MAG: hypothetical protein ACOZAO_01410 [Patescibacteria group bacterium]
MSKIFSLKTVLKLLFGAFVVLVILSVASPALERWGAPSWLLTIARGGTAIRETEIGQKLTTIDGLSDLTTDAVNGINQVSGAADGITSLWFFVLLALIVAYFNRAFIAGLFSSALGRSGDAFQFKYLWLWLAGLLVVVSVFYARSIGTANFIAQGLPLLVIAGVVVFGKMLSPKIEEKVRTALEVAKDISLLALGILVLAAPLMAILMKAGMAIPQFVYSVAVGRVLADLATSLSTINTYILGIGVLFVAVIVAYAMRENDEE